MGKKFKISEKDLERINDKDGLYALLKSKDLDVEKILKKLAYEEELKDLQAELVKMQNSILANEQKLVLIFEGRDAAGKGGAIQRFSRYLMPRHHRIVALPKPTDAEKGQWYFQRYVNQLPTEGEIVLFDRSWYNRAVVEPVNGFCDEEEYDRFMAQVNQYERMLQESGLIIVKFWLNISKDEQAERFQDRREDPMKQWKISPVDAKAQDLWEEYTHYQNAMFKQTNSEHCPWVIVDANDKKKTRLEIIRYILNLMDYEGKEEAKVSFKADKEVILNYKKYKEKFMD